MTTTLRTIASVFVTAGDVILTDGPYTVHRFADVTRPGVRVIDTDGLEHKLPATVTILR